MKPWILIAVVLVGCQQAYAQPRSAPRRVPVARPADAGAATSADAGALSRGNVIPLAPRVPIAGNWQPRCVASRGCAAMPAIAQCAAGLAARSFADVIDNRLTLAGQRVAVRATLTASGGCTEMGCPEGACCNHCSGSVYLEGSAPSSIRQLALTVDSNHPDPRFGCTGDDSGLCCGTDARGQTVVAQGVLRPVPNGGGRYYLEAPTLCTP